MNRIGWAVIGFGWMGHWHVENVTKSLLDRFTFRGVYDIRPEVLEKARADGRPTYGTLDELLADKDVELVTVATPNNFHKELSIRCLRAGKNVICEKPVTLVASDLEDIIAVAKETGRMFAVHQNRRWDRDYLIVRAILEKGELGKPYFIESRVLGSRRSLIGWRGHKENGGGILLDWGVHLLDQALDLLPGRVTSVNANLYSIYNPEVDDNIKVTLQFDTGVTFLVEMATNCFIPQPRWHVSCSDGTAVIEDFECHGRMVKLKPDAAEVPKEEDLIYTAAGPTRTMIPRPAYTLDTLELPQVDGQWTMYYENIYGVIREGAELRVKPEQSLRVMKVVDAVFESQRIGHGIQTDI